MKEREKQTNKTKERKKTESRNIQNERLIDIPETNLLYSINEWKNK